MLGPLCFPVSAQEFYCKIWGVYSGMDGMPPVAKYWVMRGPTPSSLKKRVGPHTLDKIRFWVMEEILPPDVRICEEGGSEWIKAKDMPGFNNFPVTHGAD